MLWRTASRISSSHLWRPQWCPIASLNSSVRVINVEAISGEPSVHDMRKTSRFESFLKKLATSFLLANQCVVWLVDPYDVITCIAVYASMTSGTSLTKRSVPASGMVHLTMAAQALNLLTVEPYSGATVVNNAIALSTLPKWLLPSVTMGNTPQEHAGAFETDSRSSQRIWMPEALLLLSSQLALGTPRQKCNRWCPRTFAERYRLSFNPPLAPRARTAWCGRGGRARTARAPCSSRSPFRDFRCLLAWPRSGRGLCFFHDILIFRPSLDSCNCSGKEFSQGTPFLQREEQSGMQRPRCLWLAEGVLKHSTFWNVPVHCITFPVKALQANPPPTARRRRCPTR